MQLNKHWKALLAEELKKPYFESLQDFVEEEYEQFECYPPKEQVFRAFDLCKPDDIKVVLIGQDPYHGKGQANGLCFSVNPDVGHPPSLVNILKELREDVDKPYPDSGDLSPWARQGVLLLNATLTVRSSEAGSHQGKGWERFTDRVIEKISSTSKGTVFMLWGGFARKKEKLIDTTRHHVLTCGHPSPLSANRGYWFGNRHFSRCNAILTEQGKGPIMW